MYPTTIQVLLAPPSFFLGGRQSGYMNLDSNTTHSDNELAEPEFTGGVGFGRRPLGDSLDGVGNQPTSHLNNDELNDMFDNQYDELNDMFGGSSDDEQDLSMGASWARPTAAAGQDQLFNDMFDGSDDEFDRALQGENVDGIKDVYIVM